MTVEYDGSAFHGWQTQAADVTVQATLERALETLLHTRVPLVGSGRTDAGVHARGQVAHFVSPAPINTWRMMRALNGMAPKSIAVLELSETHDGFHARYDATARRYHYYITGAPRALDRHMRVLVRPEPDFDRMNEAAALLIGQADFSAYCRARTETPNRVCQVRHAAWVRELRTGDHRFEIEADRFLHGMVRTIVGTLLEVGHGKRTVDDVLDTLLTQDRRRAGAAAPAHGLVLEEVRYDGFTIKGTPAAQLSDA